MRHVTNNPPGKTGRRNIPARLDEGYSGRRFEPLLRNLTNSLMQCIVDHDDQGGGNDAAWQFRLAFNGNLVYPSLSDKCEVVVRLGYRPRVDKAVVIGDTSHRTGGETYITLEAYGRSDWEDIHDALVHEFTHCVDYMLSDTRGVRRPGYGYNTDTLFGDKEIPRPFANIIYRLWNASEFNAWQATPHNGHTYDELLEELAEVDSNNNASVWRKVQRIVADAVGREGGNGERIVRMTLPGFRNYFVGTTFRLIKKMVRKYK